MRGDIAFGPELWRRWRVRHDMRSIAFAVVVVSGGARSMANDWIIPPRGWVLGSALSYETSRGGIGDHGLAFTDVAFLRLTARGVVKGRAEFYGGLDLLPKQP